MANLLKECSMTIFLMNHRSNKTSVSSCYEELFRTQRAYIEIRIHADSLVSPLAARVALGFALSDSSDFLVFSKFNFQSASIP